MIYAGIALIAAAIALYVLAQRSAAKARRITATQNLTPAELLALHRDVVGDADVAGAFTQTADSSGAVRCDAPLTAPMSHTACVYYRATVTAQIEERRTSTDSQGRRTTRWERDDRVVSDDERRTTFEICAADAAVAVAGEGAKFDRPVQTVERFEPHHGPLAGGISIAGMTFGADQRILGYRHVEHVLPLQAQVFVHGSADDATGRLTFRAAAGSSLLISTRSEEQIVAGAEQAASWQRIGAICGAIGGVALTVAALAGV
jgi:hypothetical protein